MLVVALVKWSELGTRFFAENAYSYWKILYHGRGKQPPSSIHGMRTDTSRKTSSDGLTNNSKKACEYDQSILSDFFTL